MAAYFHPNDTAVGRDSGRNFGLASMKLAPIDSARTGPHLWFWLRDRRATRSAANSPTKSAPSVGGVT
jgi:hypothetical protein